MSNHGIERVGFIGMGIMGSSMAKNLAKRGFKVTVYNRNQQRAEQLREFGISAVSTPQQVGEAVEILCICVTDGAAVREVLFGPSGAMVGKAKPELVLDFSTIAPNDAIKLAKEVSSCGSEYLDCPVTGGDIGAQNGTLAIMVGGTVTGFARATPVLEAMGNRIVHMGKIGNGQLTKCVNQLAGAVSIIAMTEGLVFANSAGLNLAKVLEVIGSGVAGSWPVANYAPRVLRGDLGPGFYAKDMLKDLNFVAETAAEMGISLEAGQLAKELYARFCNSGGALLGCHALIKLWDKE